MKKWKVFKHRVLQGSYRGSGETSSNLWDNDKHPPAAFLSTDVERTRRSLIKCLVRRDVVSMIEILDQISSLQQYVQAQRGVAEGCHDEADSSNRVDKNQLDLANFRDEFNRTLIHIAVKHKNSLSTIRMLLERVSLASITSTSSTTNEMLRATDVNGNTPLHFAIMYYGGSEETRAGQSTSTSSHAAPTTSVTAKLQFSNKRNHSNDSFRRLLLRGGITSTRDSSSTSCIELVELLIDKASPLDVANSDRENTCLHMAVQSGKFDVTKLLLERGANPDVWNKDQMTPLHISIETREWELTNLLIRNGASVNIVGGCNRMTPLSLSIDSRSVPLEVIELLVDYDANPFLVDSNNHNSMWYATRTNQADILAVLQCQVDRFKKIPMSCGLDPITCRGGEEFPIPQPNAEYDNEDGTGSVSYSSNFDSSIDNILETTISNNGYKHSKSAIESITENDASPSWDFRHAKTVESRDESIGDDVRCAHTEAVQGQGQLRVNGGELTVVDFDGIEHLPLRPKRMKSTTPAAKISVEHEGQVIIKQRGESTNNFERDIETAKADIETQTNIVGTILEAQLDKMKSECKTKNELLKAMEIERIKIRGELDEVTQKYNELRECNIDLIYNNQQKVTKLEESDEKIDQLRVVIDKMKEEHEASYQTNVKLNKLNCEMNSEIKELTDHILEQNFIISQEKKVLAEKHEVVKSQRDVIGKMKQELGKLVKINDDLEETVELLNKEKIEDVEIYHKTFAVEKERHLMTEACVTAMLWKNQKRYSTLQNKLKAVDIILDQELKEIKNNNGSVNHVTNNQYNNIKDHRGDDRDLEEET